MSAPALTPQYVLVEASTLELVRRALLRDHKAGLVARGEILAELTASTVALPDFQCAQPIETIRYWRDAYGRPTNAVDDPHFAGHGMVVSMLSEYLALRLALQSPPRLGQSPRPPVGTPASTGEPHAA